jgi:hypothetical protein
VTLVGRVVREAYRREAIPAPLRWTLAAAGMRDWLALVARSLREPLGERARPVVSAVAEEMFRRRYETLRGSHDSLPDPARDPRAPALLMAALYQLPFEPRRAWIFDAIGRPKKREIPRAYALLRALDHDARWRETTVHLGEMLIVLTERLPSELPRARQIVAQLCHDMGVAYATRMLRVLELEDDTPVANAIEILRTSEYLFRVNPEHRSAADEATGLGFIDGSACPWWMRPGWQPLHCGIFGQFQAGVCSVFELRYKLTTTIPKHGGDHCRVDLEPIALRRSRGGEPVSA